MQNGHLCMPRAVLVDIKQVHHFIHLWSLGAESSMNSIIMIERHNQSALMKVTIYSDCIGYYVILVSKQCHCNGTGFKSGQMFDPDHCKVLELSSQPAFAL